MRENWFSIVVPVYNGERFVDACLTYIKNQTYTNYEVVIIDNGSRDYTREKIKDFIENNPQMDINLVAVENNIGISGARNLGIIKSKYEWVSFLDVDDVWYQNKLLATNELINQHLDGDVFCHWEYRIEKNSKKVCRYANVDNQEPYYDLLRVGNKLSGTAVTVKKNKLLSINCFDTSLVGGQEDYDCWLRLARERCKFYTLQESLSAYVIHDNNTSKDVKAQLDAIYDMVDKHIKMINDEGLFSEEMIDELKRYVEARRYYAYGREYLKQGHKKEAQNAFEQSLKYDKMNLKTHVSYIQSILGVYVL